MPPNDKRADAELVAAARRGDNDAFGALVVRHQDRVYNIVLKYVGNAAAAEDVSQRVFINAFTRLKDFQDKAQFTTWVYRIAFNESITYMRYEGRRRAVSIYSGDNDGLIAEPAIDADPASTGEHEDRRALLQAALAQIDPEDRKILLLRELEEMSYEQIAEVLEVPVGTVRSRLHRAREALRDILRSRPGTRGKPLRLTPER